MDFLVKDLFDSDPNIRASALKSLDKLGVTGLTNQFQNLYKNSSKDIKSLVLENMRNNPHEDYAPLVMDFYRSEDQPDLREKLLYAMGSIGRESEEVREFLRKKTSLEERSEIIRHQAMIAVVGAQDFEFLKDQLIEWIQQSTDSKFPRALLSSLSECREPSIFLELYKFSRNFPEASDPLGQLITSALFEIYPQDMSTQASMNQIQEKIYQACRSEKADEVNMALTILSRLDQVRYRSFATRAYSALLMGESPDPSITKKKQALLSKNLPSIIDDEASRKSLASVIEKLLLRFQQILEEAKKNREGAIGANPRKDFVEFFETLRNVNLLNTVISYLKSSPPDEARRNLILSVIKKLSPSLSNRPKQLLASVIKLLMTEDGRIRSQLAIECGKINLEEYLDGVLNGISFLVDFSPQVLAHRSFKVLQPLHELCSFFPGGREAARRVLKALLHSNRQETCAYVLSKVPTLKEKEIAELGVRLSPLELIHLQPMKGWFESADKIVPGMINLALQLLESSGRVDDLEWVRVLYQIESGRFGKLAPTDLLRIRLLLARCGLTSELEQYSKGLQKRGYKLLALDIEVLLAGLEDLQNLDPESANIIRDIAYGCLSDANRKFNTEIGFILHCLGEEQGRKMLTETLSSGDEAPASTAIKLLKKSTDKSLWTEVLHTLKSDSVLIHQQVFGYFTDESIELHDERVRAEIIFLRTGERPEVRLSEEEELEQLAEDEKKDLQALFQQMRSTHMDNKTKFEMEQNMKELTIFFIDIAGYTKRSNTSDISEIMVMLDDFGQIIQPIGDRFKGNLIKKIGDCFMYTFDSPLDAVLASIEIQKQLAKHNEMTVESERLHTRIGLNTGKVFVKEGDVYGDPVNTASRVESKAPMDGLLINETTFEGVEDFIEVEKMDPIHVKGIDKPLQTYVVKGAKQGVFAMYKSENPVEESVESAN